MATTPPVTPLLPAVPAPRPGLEALARVALIAVPALVLLALGVAPLLQILDISVAESDGIRFFDLLNYSQGVLAIRINLANYLSLLTDPFYVETYLSSLRYALITTLLCLLIGFPFAYFIARAPARWRPALMLLVSLPFWTSYLLRVYACKALLDDHGAINHLLLALQWIHQPLRMLHTSGAVVLGLVYTYLPFMVLPLYGTLVRLDWRLLDAALDLGATPLSAFLLVTVPLSRAGIAAGSLLVFIPSVGEYVIPELLGGPGTLMIGRVLWDEFFSNNDWGLACAVGVSMLTLLLLPIVMLDAARRLGAGSRS